MAKTEDHAYVRHTGRAIVKLVAIAALLTGIGLAGAHFLRDPDLNRFKFNLSLPSLIGLVVTINAVSLLCLALLYAAYSWVRRDLKAPRSEDESALD